VELSFSGEPVYRNAVTASMLRPDLHASFQLRLQAEEAKRDAKAVKSCPYG